MFQQVQKVQRPQEENQQQMISKAKHQRYSLYYELE